MKNLCFSGGGVKGYCYIGVMKYLEEYDKIKDIKSLSGTSIGSFFSLLINLGYTYNEMQNLGLNMNFSLLENFDINNMFRDYGMDDGKKVGIFLNFFLKRKKFKKNITFKELYEQTGIYLSMSCCELDSGNEKIFDYSRTPNISVVFACLSSCSIPFLFNLSGQKYIDGCFSKNLPIQHLPTKDTIGFYFVNINVEKPVDTFSSYISRVLNCSLIKGNELEIEKYKLLGYSLIPVETTVDSLSFCISDKEKKLNIQYGYEACKKYRI